MVKCMLEGKHIGIRRSCLGRVFTFLKLSLTYSAALSFFFLHCTYFNDYNLLAICGKEPLLLFSFFRHVASYFLLSLLVFWPFCFFSAQNFYHFINCFFLILFSSSKNCANMAYDKKQNGLDSAFYTYLLQKLKKCKKENENEWIKKDLPNFFLNEMDDMKYNYAKYLYVTMFGFPFVFVLMNDPLFFLSRYKMQVLFQKIKGMSLFCSPTFFPFLLWKKRIMNECQREWMAMLLFFLF